MMPSIAATVPNIKKRRTRCGRLAMIMAVAMTDHRLRVVSFKSFFVGVKLARCPKTGEQCPGDKHNQQGDNGQPVQVDSFTVDDH
jgi:hypothetical protein